QHQWKPRRKQAKAKTLDEIRKEAADDQARAGAPPGGGGLCVGEGVPVTSEAGVPRTCVRQDGTGRETARVPGGAGGGLTGGRRG
ncbi:unnamed protein product, partial [Discosporangium mesarthrocarpum]